MLLRIVGGFCFGLGLALIAGLIILIPAIKNSLDTVADPAGWYGPLEGLVRGSAVFFVGTAATLLIGLIAGVVCAVLASRQAAAWSYLGFPVLAAPVLYIFLFLQGADQEGQKERERIVAQREENSRISRDAMAASARRSKAVDRANAVAKYGEPVGGPGELDRLGRLLGNLYFPGATLGTNYAMRTEPASIEWPVVSLKCAESITFEAARAYFIGLGIAGTDTLSGASVVRPGDQEPGKLYVREAKPEDPDQRITVIFIADGF